MTDSNSSGQTKIDAAAMLCFVWMHEIGIFEAEKMKAEPAKDKEYETRW